MSATVWRYVGRDFTDQEVALVAGLCADPSTPTREAIARAACRALDWRAHNGALKTMSAKVAFLAMHRDGLITLPPARHNNANAHRALHLPPGEPPPQVVAALGDLGALECYPVIDKAAGAAWNDAMARHHYLGHRPLPGAQRRYSVSARGITVALFGFGAAAWKCKARDDFIGWGPDARVQRLHLVVNNARFLVLPWVRVPNLASAALGLVARRIGEDWEATYGYRPALMETFVETPRFAGTSYKAANWSHVGTTKGRGKLDRYHEHRLPVKDVYVLALCRDFRRFLAGPP
jgi:hypothetical protein